MLWLDEGQPDTGQTENKLNELLAGPEGQGQDNQRRGIVGSVNSYMDQADPLDIAKLGGIIMGSRNMTDLGQGISALASDIQTRKTEAEAREDTLRLQEIQGDLYKAQKEKIDAEIANMQPNQLVAVMESLREMMKLDMESGAGENVAEYQSQYESVLKRYSELTGMGYQTQEERDAATIRRRLIQ